MYKLVRINNIATALLYCKLTSPQLRTQLQNISPEGNILAVGATESNRVVGLIFAEIWSDNKTAQVLSIFVVPTHRNRGIGTALLTYLEKELFLRGCTKVKLFDINHQPTTFGKVAVQVQMGVSTTFSTRVSNRFGNNSKSSLDKQ